MNKVTIEEFKKRGALKHNNKFIYDKVNFDTLNDSVCIICPKHGEFWQIAANHLRGRGCKECYKEKRSDTLKTFIEKANKVHNFTYSYDNTVYKDSRTEVCITCKEHGDFLQLPSNHLAGRGCKICAKIKNDEKERKNILDFINEANIIHNNKYSYEKVKYINNHTDIDIICPIHGVFQQTPKNHLNGNGCPICNESKLEKKIRILLEDKKINFETQKGFKWLKNTKPMKLDFYLPEYNIAIECQGLQHFNYALSTKYGWFDGTKEKEVIKEQINNIIKKDDLKRKLCEEHGIKIFYYSNLGIEYPYEVYEDFDKMLENIKNSKIDINHEIRNTKKIQEF